MERPRVGIVEARINALSEPVRGYITLAQVSRADGATEAHKVACGVEMIRLLGVILQDPQLSQEFIAFGQFQQEQARRMGGGDLPEQTFRPLKRQEDVFVRGFNGHPVGAA